jgi:hypothetical protein
VAPQSDSHNLLARPSCCDMYETLCDILKYFLSHPHSASTDFFQMTTTRNDTTTTPHFFRSISICTVVIGGKLSLLHGIVMTNTNIQSFLFMFLALGVVLLVLDDLEEDENKELASQQSRRARPVGNKTASAVKPSVSALG